MKALITGGAGFIGHHLIEHILINTDMEIICLDRLDTSGNLNRIDELTREIDDYKKRVRFVFHDLKAEINSQIAKQIGEVNCIFHLAAASHVDRSIDDPLSFVYDNVVGSCNIFNFAKNLDSVDYIQHFSTDEVYGDCPEGAEPYLEWDRCKSRNPYAATKAGAEQLGIAFHNTYQLPIITTNCMNVIGERQHPEKFLPLCINKVLNNETIFIHSYPGGDKSGTRFYVHARNVADVSLFLMKHAVPGEKYHLLGQEEVSNLQFAQFIAKTLGKELRYEMVDFHSNRPGHDLRYALADSKVAFMGYEYPVEFWKSFEKTIRWSVDNPWWLNA